MEIKKNFNAISALLLLTGLVSTAHASQVLHTGTVYEGETLSDPDGSLVLVDGKLLSSYALPKGDTAACTLSKTNAGQKVFWGTADSDLDVLDYQKVNWESEPNLTWEWSNPEDAPKDLYLAVRFTDIEWALDFDDRSGGTMPAMQSHVYSDSFDVPDCEVPMTGHTLAYWRAKSSFDETFEAEVSVGETVAGENLGLAECHQDGAVITLTPHWVANEYGVSCQLNGGNWSTDYSSPTSATYGVVFSLAAPTKVGNAFSGWKAKSGLDIATARWGTTKVPTSEVGYNTLCVNGTDDVWFVSLTSSVDGLVTLEAQWTPKQISVVFNNHGATSGKESTSATYGAAYGAVNIPTKDGATFLGYRIDDDFYWDGSGQPEKKVWDIPTNCTADAVWLTKKYQVTYHENRESGESKMTNREVEHGISIELFRGEGFSNDGCMLLGWSENPKATAPDFGLELCEGKVTEHAFTKATTLYAVWEKSYFIAYDGNGATNADIRAVQKFVFNTVGQTLQPNPYLRPGYTFVGWATNWTSASESDVKFKDRQMISEDLATRIGETNSLYAVWNANAYAIVYDANGGTGSMNVQSCVYDEPINLRQNEFKNGAYDFVGWSNDVAKVVYTNLSEKVMNLCEEPNGTNTLLAVWKLSKHSAALDCENLRWESYARVKNSTNDWAIATGDVGFGTDSCVRQRKLRNDLAEYEQQWLTTQVTATGAVSFVWKPTETEGTLKVWWTIEKDRSFEQDMTSSTNLTGIAGEWNECRLSGIPKEWYLKFAYLSTVGYVDIDRMTWIPDGYTMRFNANGGFETISDVRVAFGTTGTFPSVVPTKEANVFTGWKRSKDETLYQPGASFEDKDLTNNDEVVTFVAQWKSATPTEIPEAADGLIYNGKEQIGVPFGTGYTLVGNVGTNAGLFVATATLSDGCVWTGGSSLPVVIPWTIAPATQDVSGVTLNDAVYVYDGKSHSIAVNGTVPSGVEVIYAGSTNRTSIGTNEVTASFVVNDKVNFAAITNVLSARLIVNAASELPQTNAVPMAVKGLVYDGTAKTGVPFGTGYVLAGNVATNAGVYTATATLADGYVWSNGSTEPTNVVWTIVKATKDMSGVTFVDATVTADGQPHSLYVLGTLPAGVSVSYSGNGQSAVGAYIVTAKFTLADPANYVQIADKKATLTIKEASKPDPEPVKTDDIFVGNATYVGWIENAEGGMVGTVTVKAGKANSRTGLSQVSGTIVPLGGKKVTLAKRFVLTDQETPPVDDDGLAYYGSCVSGRVVVAGVTCSLMAYVDQFKSSDKETKAAAKNDVPSGAWTFALEDADGIQYGLSATVAAKTAKTKITGVLAAGAKLSVSATGVYNSDRSVLYVPVAYSKKTVTLGFILAVSKDRTMVLHGLTESGLGIMGVAAEPTLLSAIGSGLYSFVTTLGGAHYAEISDNGFSLSPTGVRFVLSGTKLTVVDKTVGSVKAVDGKLVVNYREGQQEPANLAKLKLKLAAKTGMITGLFVLYWLENGKVKNVTATINGVLSEDQLLGNAAIKKTGETFPVGMRQED